mgnify:FL=1
MDIIVPTKEAMEQYECLKMELESIQKEVKETEDSISKLIEEGTVCDKVTGGLGGIQGFKIEGFPVPIYEKRRKTLRDKVDRLRAKENEIMEYTEKIERYIDSIPVSRDRIIFKAIFIDGMNQKQVANRLNVDRSLISKIISKYV